MVHGDLDPVYLQRIFSLDPYRYDVLHIHNHKTYKWYHRYEHLLVCQTTTTRESVTYDGEGQSNKMGEVVFTGHLTGHLTGTYLPASNNKGSRL